MAWTVQKLIDDRMTLHASCNACHHNRQLDLSVLRERLGPDAPAMAPDLIPRLRCDGCGGRDVTLTYSPNTTPSGDIGASYRRAKDGR